VDGSLKKVVLIIGRISEGIDTMIRIKEVLNPREMDLIEEYQLAILRLGIGDLGQVYMYQKLIYEVIVKAEKRYYSENPTVISIKAKEDPKEITSKNTVKVSDLFTDEETEEVDFLRWRMSQSIFPWTRRRNEKKIKSIIDEAKKRAGVENI
jgi:hypothetical protein